MTAHEHKRKAREPSDPFGDSIVGRALRRLADGQTPYEEGSEPQFPEIVEELPLLSETVWMHDDGSLRVKFVEYAFSQSRMDGDYECFPDDPKYKEILKNHPKLRPGKDSTLTRYRDGRTELS